MTDGRAMIYLLDPSPGVTGAFVCARHIAMALAPDARVVLVVGEDAVFPEAELTCFAAVRRLPLRPLRRSARAVFGYVPALLRSGRALRRMLDEDGAEALIVNDFYLMEGWVARLLGYRGRIVTWVRIDPAAFGPVARWWLRAARAASDTLVAVSRHIAGLLPGDGADLVLYDAVPPRLAARELPAAAPTPATGEATFVFPGNYIEGKGQDLAVEALALIAVEHPAARLVFAGGDLGLPKNRAYRAALEHRAAKLGIADRCAFAGPSGAPEDALAGHLAALNLSRAESFSMTVLEASACGLPVIATRSGGPQEIVVDGVTGLLVPVGDVGAVARAMASLLSDREGARRMGRAARAHVLAQFAFDRFAAELRAIALPSPRAKAA